MNEAVMASAPNFLSDPVISSDPMFSKPLEFSSNQQMYETETTYSENSNFSSQQVLESDPIFSSIQGIASGLHYSTPQDYSNGQLYPTESSITHEPTFTEQLVSLSIDETSKPSDSIKNDISRKLDDIEASSLSIDPDFSQEPVLPSDVVISLEEAISAMGGQTDILAQNDFSQKSSLVLDSGLSKSELSQKPLEENDASNLNISSASSDFFNKPVNSPDKVISLDEVISTMYPETSTAIDFFKKAVMNLEPTNKKTRKRTRTKATADSGSKTAGATKVAAAKTIDKRKRKKKTVPQSVTDSLQKQIAELDEFVTYINTDSVPNNSNNKSSLSDVTLYSAEQILPPGTCFSSEGLNAKQLSNKTVVVPSEITTSLNTSIFSELNISSKSMDSTDALISLEDAISVICSESNISAEPVFAQESILAAKPVISLEPVRLQEHVSHPVITHSIDMNEMSKQKDSSQSNMVLPSKADISEKSPDPSSAPQFSAVEIYPTKRSGAPPIIQRGKHGKPVIILSGRRFSKQKTLKDGSITRWFCSTHAPNGCKAYLHTVGDTIVKCYNKHNHKQYRKEKVDESKE